MALRENYEFARDVVNRVGWDIAVLFPTMFVGLLLAIVFNGTTPPDTQTFGFAIIFSALTALALFASWLNSQTQWGFFWGIQHAIDERLNVGEHPNLLLAYLVIFSFIGFGLVGAFGSLIAPFNIHAPNALFGVPIPSSFFAAPNFIFTNIFSPIAEEAIFRGFLQPLLYLMLIPVFMWALGARAFEFLGDHQEITAKLLAFFFAALLQGATFGFVHISVTNGDPSSLGSSVIFGMEQAVITGIFGLSASILWHMGNNLGVTVLRAQAVQTPILTGG